MEVAELIEIIEKDEDSQHQFKSNVTNAISLAQEFIAFSNTNGGRLFIGVTDDGSIAGLTRQDMGRLNNLVSNAASDGVRPCINPVTENISHRDGLVMVVHVPQGVSRPYMDKDGIIWVKSGADKRKATSREEIQRMYQSAGLIHGDATPADVMTTNDIDKTIFSDFYEAQYDEPLADQDLSLEQIIHNLNLSKNGTLNIAGALLFGKNPEIYLPAFIVKCVAYSGNDIHESEYNDSQDMSGAINKVFDGALNFVLRNLRRIQNGQNVNSLGELEVPKVVFEELIANAIIHRDYLISAAIRIFIFSDRIEIISPGHLPNDLTIANIRNGNSNIRNPILASFATRILPYRGLGNGIRRAIKAWPHIEFEDDHNGNLFKCTIHRPSTSH
jgi:ATP-dependent DNA helicase RecG